MKIIGESVAIENKELLPQVIQRIFSVCKTDSNFPVKHESKALNGKVLELKEKTLKQMEVARKARNSREELMRRIADLEERNEEVKTELLDFLGSE